MTASRRDVIAGLGGLLALPGIAMAAPSPFTSRRIAMTVTGTGPDVILIPGLGSGPGLWSRLIADVPGYRWHRVQVRGFAGLPALDNARGDLLQPLADEIARYAATSGLRRPAIIGHSMGGMLGLMIAAGQPAWLSRLMVVDMLPSGAAMVGGTADGVGFLARQLRGYFTGTVAGRQAFANLLRDAAPDAADSDPDVLAAALDELAEIDLTPRLPRIRAPLTVVPAAPGDAQLRDAAILRARQAYAGAPTARVVPIGPSGHVVMLDQPAKFAAAVKAFLGG